MGAYGTLFGMFIAHPSAAIRAFADYAPAAQISQRVCNVCDFDDFAITRHMPIMLPMQSIARNYYSRPEGFFGSGLVQSNSFVHRP